jgi:hypothetical protein
MFFLYALTCSWYVAGPCSGQSSPEVSSCLALLTSFAGVLLLFILGSFPKLLSPHTYTYTYTGTLGTHTLAGLMLKVSMPLLFTLGAILYMKAEGYDVVILTLEL